MRSRWSPGCGCRCGEGGGTSPLTCECERLKLTATGFAERAKDFYNDGTNVGCTSAPWVAWFTKNPFPVTGWIPDEAIYGPYTNGQSPPGRLATQGCGTIDDGVRIHPAAFPDCFTLRGATSASGLLLNPVFFEINEAETAAVGTIEHNGETITFTLECMDEEPAPMMMAASATEEAKPALIFNDLSQGPCIHRGETLREERCQLCGQKHKTVEIFRCGHPEVAAPEVSEARWRIIQPRSETCGACPFYSPTPTATAPEA